VELFYTKIRRDVIVADELCKVMWSADSNLRFKAILHKVNRVPKTEKEFQRFLLVIWIVIGYVK
jgi:hypothetical protein